MEKIHEAAKELAALMEKIANSGTPPHTDYWHQSIWEAEQKLIDAVKDHICPI